MLALLNVPHFHLGKASIDGVDIGWGNTSDERHQAGQYNTDKDHISHGCSFHSHSAWLWNSGWIKTVARVSDERHPINSKRKMPMRLLFIMLFSCWYHHRIGSAFWQIPI
jgi:hypothetical protein